MTTNSLSHCLGKAGKAISQQNKDAILERSSALRAEGLGVDEAAAQAVSEHLDTLVAARATLASAPRKATGGQRSRSAAWDANPFKEFLGQHGIALKEVKEFAPGMTERRAAMVPGHGPIFRGTGKSLDVLTQTAIEDGFLPLGASQTQLADLIHRALQGERVIPQYAEGAVEREVEALARQAELEHDASVDVSSLSDESFAALEADDSVPWDAVANPSTRDEGLRALGATEQEIENDAIAEGTSRAQEGAQGSGEPGQGASGQAQPDPQAGTGAAPEEGLTSPTREDILAQQDRTESVARASEQAKQAAESKAAADAALPGFTLTGSDRTADANTDQRPMFSRADQTQTEAFKTWFGDSKVVDADGKPLVVYHGTNKTQDGDAFTAFDPYGSNYGLFGQGAYFTESADVASSYVKKGKGDAPTVYPAFMNLRNPIDMDAKADDAAWRDAFASIDFDAYPPTGETNEAYYRAAEEDLTDQGIPSSEGAEIMQDGLRKMGHDGITHIGGGRVKSEGVKHRVFVAFDPEQVKSATGNSGAFDASNPSINMSRADMRRGQAGVKDALTKGQVERAIQKLTMNWLRKPSVKILETLADAPDAVIHEWMRQNEGGAGGGVKGFHLEGDVYLIADQLTSGSDVIQVLFHEALGHFGLRGVFGESLTPILKQIATLRGKEMAAKAEQYGLDLSKEEDRMTAAEEILANMAETHPELGFVRRAIAAIRTWLRAHVPGFDDMKLSDDEIIRSYILPARSFVVDAAAARGAPAEAGPTAMFSRATITGQTSRQYTPEQERAMGNVGFQVQEPSLKERAQALWQDAGKKLAQGIVDQFAPVKDLSQEAYGLLRLAKGASGAFEAFLRGGQLKLTDGVYDFDDSKRGGVVDKLLIPLQGEHHDFMRWVAANRAERLMTEGKEHLFTAQDIADLKTLSGGQLSFDYSIQHGAQAGTTTRDRSAAYRDSLATFNEFNKNALDMAEQSGLIDGASRHLWEHEFYVPFYRVADDADGGVRGMNIKGAAVRQQAFKALKGGKNALNADLLDNTLMNWAHLLDAAAKNRAAKATLEAAERMGVAIGAPQSTAQQIGSATGNKNGVVWFMDGGQKRFFVVDDPYVLTAISSLEFAGMRSPVMNAMGAFKHALTVGVTASPFFKVRNLIRDSVQVIATSPIGVNPAANIAQGWKLTSPKSDAYFRLLAGGGTIHFGTMLEGSEAKRVQALVESGVDDSTILNSDDKVKAFYRKFIEPGITAYNELGNRGEAINRAALYAQLTAQGVNHAEASLQARDLMDFSMQGSFTSIRFLTQVVPFANARIQGLWKLARAAKEDPARFSAVLGATALFSLALLAAYSDDDDWKKRELWDRQGYWWFKFGGTAFRIPKPFEIGAIATLAEHGAELMFNDEMTGTQFRKAVLQLVSDNLSMNPVPQMVKPVIDVYSNKDSFTGRPIESMGMEKLKPEFRFNDRTSMAARGASTALNATAGLVGAQGPSPVQIDHLLRGYFGWLGSFVVGAGDVLARPATDQPGHAAPDYWKTVTGGMLSDLRDAPSKYVSQMYDQAKEIEQAYGTWRSMVKEGKTEDAEAFRLANQPDLQKYHQVERVKRTASGLHQQIKVVERSDLTADEKRDRIRVLQERVDRLARTLAPA